MCVRWQFYLINESSSYERGQHDPAALAKRDRAGILRAGKSRGKSPRRRLRAAVRVSPLGSRIGFAPPAVSSSRQPAAVVFVAGDGAGGQQVAGQQIAAVAGVVRNQLRGSPIKVAQIGPAQPVRRVPGGAHRRGQQECFQRQVDRAGVLVRRVEQITAAAPGPRRGAARQERETARAPPSAPPRAKRWWQSSWPEKARAADTPRTGCRAPTSRSPERCRRFALPAWSIGTGSPSALPPAM